MTLHFVQVKQHDSPIRRQPLDSGGASKDRVLPSYNGVKQKGVIEHCRMTFYCIFEPGSKLVVLGMAIPPLIGNPYNGYINPYYWVDDHPPLYGNNGSLHPSTFAKNWMYLNDRTHDQIWTIFEAASKAVLTSEETLGAHGNLGWRGKPNLSSPEITKSAHGVRDERRHFGEDAFIFGVSS